MALVTGVLSLLVAYMLRLDDWWLPLFFVCFGVVWFLASWECFVSYMHLGNEDLEYRMNFKRVRIKKTDIEKVTWEAGCGVSVQLVDGSWQKLPGLGQNSQGITNSIRAWLARN